MLDTLIRGARIADGTGAPAFSGNIGIAADRIVEVCGASSRRIALHVGWHDRGVIAPGYLADLNLIDMDKIALPPPVVVNE